MPIIRDVIDGLRQIEKIHKLKNDDYSNEDNPFDNFDFAIEVSRRFNNDRDKVFATLCAVKDARLYNLMNKKEAPNNESIEDTLLDRATYTLLWRAHRLRDKVVLNEEEVNGRASRLNTA